jgi:hypothetical protein
MREQYLQRSRAERVRSFREAPKSAELSEEDGEIGEDHRPIQDWGGERVKELESRQMLTI